MVYLLLIPILIPVSTVFSAVNPLFTVSSSFHTHLQDVIIMNHLGYKVLIITAVDNNVQFLQRKPVKFLLTFIMVGYLLPFSLVDSLYQNCISLYGQSVQPHYSSGL